MDLASLLPGVEAGLDREEVVLVGGGSTEPWETPEMNWRGLGQWLQGRTSPAQKSR